MVTWKPDPSFYPSPRQAAKAPPESLAYVAMFDPDRKGHDGIAVVDVDPASKSYAKIVSTITVPSVGDEFHHFGWNACSSCLSPNLPHPHVERRYLVVRGIRSSRIYIFDTKPDPRVPKIIKTIEPEEIAEKTGYTRPHTVHCGPQGIYVSALGDKDGNAPGGIFIMDNETFEPLGRWEIDRGPQQLAYDAWWHLGYDTVVTSEWGTPDTFENGLVPDVLLGSRYGHRLHFWDLIKRRHLQEIDLGKEHQLIFELRPRSFSSNGQTATDRTRLGYKVATARRIPTVIRRVKRLRRIVLLSLIPIAISAMPLQLVSSWLPCLRSAS